MAQILAKDQELQRVLREQPGAPPKKDISATIESMGTSVAELGNMLKAKGLEQDDADVLRSKLKECMDMLRHAGKKVSDMLDPAAGPRDGRSPEQQAERIRSEIK